MPVPSRFKAKLWLCEDHPLSLCEQVAPIIDLMAISNALFAKLRDFITLRLPPGFPVKIGTGRGVFATGVGSAASFPPCFSFFPVSYRNTHLPHPQCPHHLRKPQRVRRARQLPAAQPQQRGALAQQRLLQRQQLQLPEYVPWGGHSWRGRGDTGHDDARHLPAASCRACEMDPALFEVPRGYSVVGTHQDTLREDEDDLLQFAIQQSLLEAGSEYDQVGTATPPASSCPPPSWGTRCPSCPSAAPGCSPYLAPSLHPVAQGQSSWQGCRFWVAGG